MNAHARAARHLLAEKGNQKWSEADQATFDVHVAEVEALQDRLASMSTDASGPRAVRAQHFEALDLYLRRGMKNLSPDEARKVHNALSTSTGSQGGFAVPQPVASELVSLLKGYGFMRAVASQMTTGNGAAMTVPTSDGTNEVGELVTENSQAGSQDPSFGARALPTFKFSSKVFTVPLELLQDAQIDIVGFIMQRSRERIGRAQNPLFTNGSGTGQPTGLVTAASVGKVGATGQTVTLVYDDLADLVDSVDDAHFGMPTAGDATPARMPGWMFSQATRKVVRKIKDSSGRPIWTPAYIDAPTGDRQSLLLEYPVYLNNDMPAPGANAKSVAFGNLASYVIRDALDVSLYRFEDSAFMTKGQAGFLAWSRAGGTLLDLGAVKLYQHPAT